eukprot:3911846-Amphidinium_carterae.2
MFPGADPDDEPATQRARQAAFVGPLMHHDETVKTGIVEKLPSKGHKDLFLKGSRIIKILTPVLADQKWAGFVGDVSQAFTQAAKE